MLYLIELFQQPWLISSMQLAVLIGACLASVLPGLFAAYLWRDKRGIGRVMSWMFISTCVDMLVVADFAYGSYIKVYNKMGVWETMGLRALMIVVAIFASVNAFRYIKKIRKEATRRDRRSSDRAARSQ